MSYRALKICGEHPKYLQVQLLWWKNWQWQMLARLENTQVAKKLSITQAWTKASSIIKELANDAFIHKAWVIIYRSTGVASTHVCWIKIIFKIPCPKIKNIPDYSTRFFISLHRFLSFENWDISKDNIISGKAAKVSWYDKYNTIGLVLWGFECLIIILLLIGSGHM